MRIPSERKKGVIFTYISVVINFVMQLFYTPILTRMLGQSEYGLYSLVSSIIGYLGLLDLGFGNALVVYTAKFRAKKQYDKEKQLQGMFLLIFCIIGLIAVILSLILYFNIQNIFQLSMTADEIERAKIMILILAFNLAITFSFSVYSSIITAHERFTFQKLLSIAGTILQPVLMVPLLFMGFKSIALCGVVTLVNIAIVISNYIYCRKKLSVRVKFMGIDRKLFKIIFNYSFFVFLATIIDMVNYNVDQFILGIVSGTVAVSIYAVATKINSMFINLSSAVSSVMLPKISRMVAKKSDTESLTTEWIKAGRLQFYIVFAILVGFMLVGADFINLWVGTGYTESYIITLILMVPAGIVLLQSLGLTILQAKNMHHFRSVMLLAIAILNVAISIFLSKLYGGIGAAIGTSLSLILGNLVILNIYYKKKVGLDVSRFWKTIMKMVCISMLPTVLAVGIKYIFNLSGIVNIIITGLVFIVSFVIVSYYLTMDQYERMLVNKVCEKIIPKKFLKY